MALPNSCHSCHSWQTFAVHPFVRNLLTEWRRLELPFEADSVVIGVSGGADSVSLLLAMHELKKAGKLGLRIIAAHFNHKLRGDEADRDEAYVRDLTTERKIEFAVGHAETNIGGNLEQNARIARYDFLKKTADNVGAFAVLTAHTINDQAETFLMNLIRGSGPQGLGGIRPIRNFKDSELMLIRPMLTWAKRENTERFCRDLGVDYCCDTMNEDTAFKRVRIRKILLPLLEDMNPNIVETLANTAGLMQTTATTTPLPPEPAGTDDLKIADLKPLPQSTLYATIRDWLKIHRGTTRSLELKHIQAIERLVNSVKSGRVAEVPGGRVVKSGGRLRYEANKG
jgi:tRNA(Ile)-lysidine synthase